MTKKIDEPMVSRDVKVCVRTYVDPNHKNMGLEKYGMALFDGIKQGEQLMCLERNGVREYITGLNEHSSTVENIKDPEKKRATVKSIREKVAFLERQLAQNELDVKDADFWKKVKIIRNDNHEFWNGVQISVGNEPMFLDPKNPMDLIKISAIEAGGFTLIARSLEDLRGNRRKMKFYLDKEGDTATTNVGVAKIKNKALGILNELFDSAPQKLMYIAKVVDANSQQYRNKTPNDVIYQNMDKFINGHGSIASVKKASDMFTEAADSSVEDLKIRAIVNDAVFYQYLISKSDGTIRDKRGDINLGRNMEEVVESLKSPLHDKTAKELMDLVENHWSN